MNRHPRAFRRHPPKDALFAAPELEGARIVERPDGFWVQPARGGRERGPFASYLEAFEDQRGAFEGELEPGSTLLEAEEQLGLADWIDPETREPAEGHVPHIEEH